LQFLNTPLKHFTYVGVVHLNFSFEKITTLKKISILLSVFTLSVIVSCSQAPKKKNSFTIKGPVAPEINTSYGWVNTDSAYTLKDFRGKIVLLDFWTLGCINCQHVIPGLHKLQEKYPHELVEIGVHSAKFTSEKQTQRIRDAIAKFGIDHPVVNDADYKVWDSYGVQAWPTLVLISPDGKIVMTQSGEDVYNIFDGQIQKLINEYAGEIDTIPFIFKQRNIQQAASVLKFPSKIIAGGNNTIWISDNGNNRIVNIDETGKILQVIGKGGRGFTNGTFAEATFNEPEGMAIKNNILFIADSKNNAIRAANLSAKTVTTIAGNGQMGYYFDDAKWDVPILPNSPWDLLIDSDYLYIADAGNHQILRMNLHDNNVFRFAGSGREGIQDGNLRQCSFSQPSGIAWDANFIYVADPEASAIRQLDIERKTVKTIVGKGLFDFGDKDGKAKNALLQHCAGLTASGGNVYIADTYNGKVKVLDQKTNTVTTLVNGLDEPNGILVLGNELWITDTNNNQIIKYNLIKRTKQIVNVRM
jgi:YVTN family beta-propeller protein